ncbi:MAG: hypothetical protein H6R46_830 [Proteobacteria bacterium]|nr:hypothetical protein [Pseudomonadota bacterium]
MSLQHFALALLAASMLVTPMPALAAERSANAIPHINDRARQGYQQYLQAEMHRAYAVAPGGTWAWKYGFDTREEAVAAATAACQQGTEQTCVPYAINDDVVFNARQWSTLWRPYKTAAEAMQAPEGQHRGERFPDLLLKSASGKPVTLSSLRGKVVLLHLWGTWCPSCVHEIPQFQELMNALRDVPQVVFVFSQVREPYADARRWLEQRGIRLPVYDSGSHAPQDTRLQLASGGTLADRAVAPVFPVTYVLDRHGIVVFSLRGSASDWLEYTAFLRDVAAHSK